MIPQEDWAEGVTEAVQGVLGFAPGLDQPLMEAGLDSLGAVELRNSLASRFRGQDLPATLIFDYATISALAGYFAGQSLRASTIPLPTSCCE